MPFKRNLSGLEWICRPIAHRGLHDKSKGIVENTPSSIQAALDNGYAVEVDLQPAAGNIPVVFHDSTLERLTSSQGHIREHSVQELKKISFKDSADKIATLSELLDQVNARVPIILEVKSNWTGDVSFMQSVADTINGYDGNVAVMSFDPAYISALAKLAPAIPRGLVSERFGNSAYWSHLSIRQRFLYRHLITGRIAKPHFIAYDINGLPSLAPIIARNIFAMRLLTWTVRTMAQKKRAEKWTDAMIFEGFRP